MSYAYLNMCMYKCQSIIDSPNDIIMYPQATKPFIHIIPHLIRSHHWDGSTPTCRK